MFNLLASIPVPRTSGEVVSALVLSLNETYIAVTLQDTSVHVFSLIDGAHKLRFSDPCGQAVWAISLLGSEVVIGSGDGVLRVWGVVEGTLLHEIYPAPPTPEYAPINRLYSLSSTSNLPSVLVTTRNGTIRQWSTGTKSYSRAFLGGHSATIFDIKACDDGKRFVSADYEGAVCAWNLTNGSMLWTVKSDAMLFGLAVEEQTVALGRKDGDIRLLRLQDGSEIAAFNAHTHLINGLIFYKDCLISTGTDGFAKIWSISTGDKGYKLKQSMKLHDHAVVARCMLGPWLITGGKEGGGDDNVCGIDCTVKVSKIDSSDSQDIREIGTRSVVVWKIASLESAGKFVSLLMKRGRPTLEIWESLSSIS